MRAPSADRVTGLVFLILAAAWVALVWRTIPPGQGPVGPRSFPLALGLLLMFLSGWLMLFGAGGEPDAGAAPARRDGVTLRMLAATFAAIALYGLMMERIGFVLATAVVVLSLLWLVLGIRNRTILIGLTLGIPLGCWLVFGKLLGSHLPRSPWFLLF